MSIHIERCQSCKEVLAFIPKKSLSINLSIGGTKIAVAIVNSSGEVCWESDRYQWRSDSEDCSHRDSAAKREWFISLILTEIMKAEDYSQRYLKGSLIEQVGISWAGPVSRDGKVMGPNIDGFRFQELSLEERLNEGVDLAHILREKLMGFGRKWEVSILNDADAAAIVAFRQDGNRPNGMLVIIGTGIGLGIIMNEKSYFGPEDFICRMGEIGHHLLYNPSENRYFYYGCETKGVILEENAPLSLTRRLSGPGVARMFVDRLYVKFHQNLQAIIDYFHHQVQGLDTRILTKYFQERVLPLNIEEQFLKCITENARSGDQFCIDLIKDVGDELGRALGVFIAHFKQEPYVNHIKLAGSMGELFALGVHDKNGRDLFLERIKPRNGS